MLNREDLPILTQSLLAVVITVGCGIALFLKPDLSDKVIPVLTFVVTFYFSTAAVQKGVVLGQQQVASGKVMVTEQMETKK